MRSPFNSLQQHTDRLASLAARLLSGKGRSTDGWLRICSLSTVKGFGLDAGICFVEIA
jgi:hypothetical protein